MRGYLIKGFRFIVVLGLLALVGQVFTSPNASVVPLSSCPGDFDGNGRVNIADFLAFAGAFGARSGDAKYNAVMDMDSSGAIDISDFLSFAGVFGTTCEKTSPEVLSDREALVLLYSATRGQGWVNNENWLTDAPLGEWYGVETDASGRVITLKLTQNGLTGVLSPEISQLASLTQLDLNDNQLTGSIPPELGKLSQLRSLAIGSNYLEGSIPPELGNLTQLQLLGLAFNQLTGSIPPELGSLIQLRDLGLRGNQLSGPIPAELGNLSVLQYLRLRENQLSGSIPPELGSLTRLRRLELGDNQLSGSIPPELGNLAELGMLWLRHNQLTGPIPPELGNLRKLGLLWLDSNQLTGPIPPELGKLSALNGVILSHNMLSGPISSELGNLHSLVYMYLHGNELTGPLPRSFLGLQKLEVLNIEYGTATNRGLCISATAEFKAWARQVEDRGNVDRLLGPFCNEVDKRALEALYQSTNGSNWTRSNGWLNNEDLGQWHGVRTNSTGRVSGLDLSGNGLSGRLPEALGQLTDMRELRLGNNALIGRLPLSLVGVPLEEFDYGGTSLCGVDDHSFWGYLNGIPRHTGTGVRCPPPTDREILELLYLNTGGLNWNQADGWLSDADLSEWHGVETDAAGRVVELRLPNNGLTGSLSLELGGLSRLKTLDLRSNQIDGGIPTEIGKLSELEALYLGGNRFSGAIPAELGDLISLRVLNLGGNQLTGSIPSELGKFAHLISLNLGRNFLSGQIPSELGNLDRLDALDLQRNQLSDGIPGALGRLSALTDLRLRDNRLTGPIPSELGDLGHLETLDLQSNQIGGGIPTEIGKLGALEQLFLADNQLTGPIPAELGGLTNLRELRFSGNDLSGAIPARLGDLVSLTILDLTDNRLSGSIPARLGDLTNLTTLNLGDNELTGPLPIELGHATKLEGLDVRFNALTGPVPPEFGNLTLLKSLILADNPGLSGPLPPSITSLEQLDLFMAGGTALCRPAASEFTVWFRAIGERRLVRCEGGASAYLTQTVQSWDDPVPLLAGEPALLRVFVTAPHGGTVTMPDVRATFFVDGAERHTIHIPATTQAIPPEVIEGNLEVSVNVEIPDWVIVPGLEMVIEVDPEGALDPALGVTRRIPEEGRMTVDIRRVSPFHLTLVPFLWETDPDLSVIESVSQMVADPDGHELLRDVRTLLPIADFEVAAREPVITSTKNPREMMAQVAAVRLVEGGTGHWMGIFGESERGRVNWPLGVARRGGYVSTSEPRAGTIAHELGHNLGLRHAPCACGGVDPWFPHAGGRIGAWGYDFDRSALVQPGAPDVMSYCRQGLYWISDFFFNKALSHRLANEGATTTALAAAADPTRTLLIWGGRDQDGVPYLDPAFVVEATPSIPTAGEEYTIVGAAADGTPIFSFSFDMPVTADVEGEETSFVFALPVQGEWAGNLSSITLSGPGGSATLDESTDRPMAILRDPKTQQVRGFLSDLPSGEAAQSAAKRAVVADPELEVLFSRGIPDLR